MRSVMEQLHESLSHRLSCLDGTDKTPLADVVDTSFMKSFEFALKKIYKLGHFCACRPKLVDPPVSINIEIVSPCINMNRKNEVRLGFGGDI